MWYQATLQFDNPLSPRRLTTSKAELHAHSPRHTPRSAHNQVTLSGASLRPDAIGIFANTVPLQLPDPFIADVNAAYVQSMPQIEWPTGMDTNQMPKKNITFSRGSASISDVSMPDYSRSLSPKSLPSVQMLDYSHPPSLHGSQTFTAPFDSKPAAISSRSASYQYCNGEQPSAGFGQIELPLAVHDADSIAMLPPTQPPTDGMTPTFRSSTSNQADDSFNIYAITESPTRISIDGTLAPTNTRANSAANTPPSATHPSAAKKAREASYSGKKRVTSIASRDQMASVACNLASDSTAKISRQPRSMSLGALLKSKESPNFATMTKTPSSEIRSKKEGRLSNIGLDIPSKHQQSLSRRISDDLDKENVQTNSERTSSAKDPKRRR